MRFRSSTKVWLSFFFALVPLKFASSQSLPPNDGWSIEREREIKFIRPLSVGVASGQIALCYGISSQTFDDRLLLLDANLAQVLDLPMPCKSAIPDGNGGAYVYERAIGGRLIRVNSSGAIVQTLASAGINEGELRNMADIIVHPLSGEIFTVDLSRERVLRFSPDGTFLQEWGRGAGPRSFLNMEAIRPYGNNVVLFNNLSPRALVVYSIHGEFISSFDTSLISSSPSVRNFSTYFESFTLDSLSGISPATGIFTSSAALIGALRFPPGSAIEVNWDWFSGDLYYVVDSSPDRLLKYRMGYRTQSTILSGTRPPHVAVTSVSGRSSSTVADIDFVIRDPDSATALVHAFLLTGGVQSLTNYRPVNTLLEGSGANIGPGVPTNITRRLVWDATADLGTGQSFVNAAVNVVANDGRGLLDLHFVTVPAGIPNAGDPALQISSVPVQDAELLEVWFWLLASKDPAVSISNGEVRGVGGAFAGQLLASGTSTTAAGKSFLWQRLGVREATAAEVTRARTGTTPGVQQFEPLKRVGSNPIKVNEIGVDTGATTGTWLVRLSGS